ncbi:ImuA family protein [Thalassococcus sp. BH17M4-6]|uniref:ImuA family protein n=1 Tax=Thalassococcus sp. BH17M4-6 TaxID=3413148 RepID=UPI003BC478CE
MGVLQGHKRLLRQMHQPAQRKHTLSEVFPATACDAAAVGFVLSRLPRRAGPILWVQDRLSRKEAGRPCLAGIGTARPVIMVDLSRAVDVLWAMEDGLRCKALAAVIGEVWGDPPALDFTATKRLALRSEAAEVPCWLIRRAASADLSAARERFRIASLPSAPHPDDAQAPGLPRWSLDLFRSRRTKPGQWVATYDRAADRLDLVAAVRDGTLAAGDGTAGRRAVG